MERNRSYSRDSPDRRFRRPHVIREQHRSRSPIVIRMRSRSRSPIRIIRERSRSRSPIRRRSTSERNLYRSRHSSILQRKSRSRSPEPIIVPASYRHVSSGRRMSVERARSRSPQRIIVARSPRHASPQRIIVVGSPRHASPTRQGRSMERARSRSPRQIIVDGSPRHASPTRQRRSIERARSRSTSPIIVDGTYHPTPQRPVIVETFRSPWPDRARRVEGSVYQRPQISIVRRERSWSPTSRPIRSRRSRSRSRSPVIIRAAPHSMSPTRRRTRSPVPSSHHSISSKPVPLTTSPYPRPMRSRSSDDPIILEDRRHSTPSVVQENVSEQPYRRSRTAGIVVGQPYYGSPRARPASWEMGGFRSQSPPVLIDSSPSRWTKAWRMIFGRIRSRSRNSRPGTGGFQPTSPARWGGRLRKKKRASTPIHYEEYTYVAEEPTVAIPAAVPSTYPIYAIPPSPVIVRPAVQAGPVEHAVIIPDRVSVITHPDSPQRAQGHEYSVQRRPRGRRRWRSLSPDMLNTRRSRSPVE
jgi:hypothetical protein